MKHVNLYDLIRSKYPPIKGFPPAVVEQTNYRVSDVIRRNQAGEQIMGTKNLVFDFAGDLRNADLDKVNPFNSIGFDLDDVIILAQEQGRAVTSLQNRLGEIKADIDKMSKSVENDKQEGKLPVEAAPQVTTPQSGGKE